MEPSTLAELFVTPASPPRLSVAAAAEPDVLGAVTNAAKQGLIRPILIGDAGKIRAICEDHGWQLGEAEIVDQPDVEQAVVEAVRQVRSGTAHVLMKGLVDTSVLLKAVLDKERGLRSGRVLSHVALFQVPGYDRLLTVTDAAMNIAPDLETKEQILLNAVDLLRSLGYQEPRVAVLAAKEKVNPKMQATVDAAELVERNRTGRISRCLVAGPYALDNAVSREAAETKGITGPVAGRADILLAPNIETGNVLYKALAFLARAETAGVIVGAAAPIVLTSRADSELTKLNSIAIAARSSTE